MFVFPVVAQFVRHITLIITAEVLLTETSGRFHRSKQTSVCQNLVGSETNSPASLKKNRTPRFQTELKQGLKRFNNDKL